MGVKYSKSVMIFTLITLFLQQFANSATLFVDGVSKWKNLTVQVGDSIIFRHKYNYNLYILKNRRAFNLCNFSESTLLTPASPTVTGMKWHPSRLGSFYFSFRNSSSTKACDAGEKLAIQVSSSLTPETSTSPPLPQTLSPTTGGGGHVNSVFPSPQPSSNGDIISSTPTPTSTIGSGGGITERVSSSPSHRRLSHLKEVTSPSPSPMNSISPPQRPPMGSRGGGGGGSRRNGGLSPLVNRVPPFPIPDDQEVDSATILPVPGLYLTVLFALIMNY